MSAALLGRLRETRAGDWYRSHWHANKWFRYGNYALAALVAFNLLLGIAVTRTLSRRAVGGHGGAGGQQGAGRDQDQGGANKTRHGAVSCWRNDDDRPFHLNDA